MVGVCCTDLSRRFLRVARHHPTSAQGCPQSGVGVGNQIWAYLERSAKRELGMMRIGLSSPFEVQKSAPLFFPHIIGDNGSWFACCGTPHNRPSLDRRLS
jgi:hypothetical protein